MKHILFFTPIFLVSAAVASAQDTSQSTETDSHKTCPDSHHPHLIDLGLPSGTKWACCNVGASKPEDYGNYYVWGETEPKSTYNESTYKYYQNNQYVSIGSDIAGTSYDVANVKWGGSWKMPSLDQIKELTDNCSFEWTTENGIQGRRFKGKNGGSIFLPAAGYRWNDDLYLAEDNGYYWSSMQYMSSSDYACCLYFGSDDAGWDSYCYRELGRTVRPIVQDVQNLQMSEATPTSLDILVQSAIGEVDPAQQTSQSTPTSPQSSAGGITSCPDSHHPHIIDLGLPSGTKWACCNVGASKPEDYGNYYAWGETETKSSSTYKYYKNNQYVHLGYDIAGTSYDVAHVKWGSSWEMPSHDQIEELKANCSSVWTTENGIEGRRFKGKNGSSIFLPAAGEVLGSDPSFTGTSGYYWSSTQDTYFVDAYSLDFASYYAGCKTNDSKYGYTVRPIVQDVQNKHKPQSSTGGLKTCPDSRHPHKIDLGLPSGTKWACCNVGASKPENYGNQYAWGETETKATYNLRTYKYYRSGNYVSLGSDISGTSYDVAHVKWGGSWKMPSPSQIKELIDNCTSEVTRVNGVSGRRFIGRNGGSIFLPVAGKRENNELKTGPFGLYWSSSPSYFDHARDLYFTTGYAIWSSDDYRHFGHSVRPVSK